MQKKVVIVGAGLGGLTAGFLLSQKGFLVTVYEREATPGGRAMTLSGSDLNLDDYKSLLHRFDMWMARSDPPLEAIFRQGLLKGYRIDLGFHLLGFIAKSPVVRLLKRTQHPLKYTESRFGLLAPNGGIHSIFLSYLSLADVLKTLPHLLRLRLATPSVLRKYEDLSMSQIIDRYCYGTVATASEIATRLVATVNDMERIAAGEILRVGKKWDVRITPTGFPAGGSGAIADILVQKIIENGGSVRFQSPVERLVIKECKITGIEADSEFIPCDLCISNLPIQDLHTLVDSKDYPGEDLQTFKRLEGTGSVCVYYGLRRVHPTLTERPYAFQEQNLPIEGGTASGIIDFQTSRHDMGLSPPDRYLVQGYIICTPSEARKREVVNQLIRVLDDKMEMLYPGFRDHLDFALYPTCYHLDGVAKTLDMPKPKNTTPVNGLYLVGDCIHSTGIGMNCAMDSAVRLVAQLKG